MVNNHCLHSEQSLNKTGVDMNPAWFEALIINL